MQEAHAAPVDNVSALVLNYCQAEAARKDAAKAHAGKAGEPAPAAR